MIEIKNLRKEYPGSAPIRDLSLTVNDGDVIAIIGPSGVGKSTLIRCMNLLEIPTGGQIFLNGQEITAKGYDVKAARRKMGMVFQSFHLFGHLTVIENLMIPPMDLLGISKQEAYDKAMELLGRVGLAEKALSYPEELSGGQKQRVAIARTLCMDPEVILLDEPTSALDPTMVSEVQTVIRDLAKSGKTMLIVTHEMNFAKSISNRVVYLDEGGIYEEGTPEEIFQNPKREKTRRFIRRLRVFEEYIDSKDYDFISFGVKLDQYMAQNEVTPSEKYKIRLTVEEIMQQILLPRFDRPNISVAIEYSEQEKSGLVSVKYGGPEFDIKDTDNDLSLKILYSVSEDITYSYHPNEERPNQVMAAIRPLPL